MPNDIPGFPTIVVGGQTFFDISHLVADFPKERQYTRGLALHHSVTGTSPGESMESELQHIRAINAYHLSQGYGGFGYNGCVFPFSGRVYVVGRGNEQRAHVAQRNHELEGLCVIGTYTEPHQLVPLGGILGGGRWLLAKYRQRGLLVTQGHGQWAVPAFASACPGWGMRIAIPQMMAVAVALAKAGQ